MTRFLRGDTRPGRERSLRVAFGCALCLLLAPVLLGVGCRPPWSSGPRDTATTLPIKRVVVVGFRPALTTADSPRMVRSPLSGAVFAAEPVPRMVAAHLTTLLFDRLVGLERYDLVTPDQARGAISTLVAGDRVLSEIETYRKVGQMFSADGVLIGYLYRWQERLGTAYGVREAASVAFDLNLIHPADGRFLWKCRFDKTQRSLSEDLFDMDTFLRSGGHWLSAEELSELGLDDCLKGFPGGEGI